MNTRYIAILILALLLSVGALACGGGSDPVTNDPGTQGNTGGTTLTGRVLDREGTPRGAPWVTVTLKVQDGGAVAPGQQPDSDGPDAGVFRFVGLPIGIPLVLEIELYQVSLGRNLGWIHNLTLTTGGEYDLGDIVLENDFLDNGWSAYVSKEYSWAIINFNRAFEDRFLHSNLTYSSSAYTGLGWVYAKRGKDNQTGVYYADPGGNWLDYLNSYEWDQALLNFDRAVTNPNDADAWVGMGGTYMTLLGQSLKDPVLMVAAGDGPELPFYYVVEFYFDNAQRALDKALLADPDYKCSHDEITADDLRATLLFLHWIQGHPVSLEEVTSLAASGDLNQGSYQLLSILPDLIQYQPFPQL